MFIIKWFSRVTGTDYRDVKEGEMPSGILNKQFSTGERHGRSAYYSLMTVLETVRDTVLIDDVKNSETTWAFIRTSRGFISCSSHILYIEH